jgi:hypothetical protein
MTRLEGLIKGLQLFSQRVNSKNQSIAAEHDIIYGPHKDAIQLTAEEEANLKEMGWHMDSEVDCWSFFV